MSGTLVNLAYVQRKAALSMLADEQTAVARQRCATGLLEALAYARMAVSLKERLEDRDELPVALHNLALIGICLKLVTPESGMPADTQLAARRGLDLIDRAGADKKRFALLLEAWMTALLNDENAAPIADSLGAWVARNPNLPPEERATIPLLGAATGVSLIGQQILGLQLLN